MSTPLSIRFAEERDLGTILSFIRALAEYEHAADEVLATTDILRESLFRRKMAEVLLGEWEEKPVCFALFCHNFSTWLGVPGIHLEDLFVLKEYRGHGFGRQMLRRLAQVAVERGCGRLEWACLDWNTPSIAFYKDVMHAQPLDEWTTYRLSGETLKALANE